jgi:hypothetical protein
MLEDMAIRNLSPATQQSYLYAVAKFSRRFGRSPDRLGIEEARAYQVPLAAKQRSWPHINQVSCALRFFYGVTPDIAPKIVSARTAKAAGGAVGRRDRDLSRDGAGVARPHGVEAFVRPTVEAADIVRRPRPFFGAPTFADRRATGFAAASAGF